MGNNNNKTIRQTIREAEREAQMELWKELRQAHNETRRKQKKAAKKKALRDRGMNKRDREKKRRERSEQRKKSIRKRLSKEEWRKRNEKRKIIKSAPDVHHILDYFKHENLKKQTPSEIGFETLLKKFREEKYPQLKYESQKIWEYPRWRVFYIIDFYVSFPKKIAFEIDGKYHEKRQAEDKLRDEHMTEYGIRVVRFKNDDIRYRFEWVYEQVLKTIES
mgnify:CR=1 FL=1